MSDTPHSLLEQLHKKPDDSLAWTRLVGLYSPFLKKWARRWTGLPDHDIDDLVQNVLGVVVRKIGAFEHHGHSGAFRAWLKAVLANCWREFRRRPVPLALGAGEGKQPWDELEDPHSHLSQVFDQEHDQMIVQELLRLGRDNFSSEHWAIFEEVALKDRAPDAVAAEYKTTRNAVYLIKSRVLHWLRTVGQGLVERW
ncbi:MAG: sigma-70 family RNA polymerase sigma factor [Gemmataceae bacterium]